MSQFTLLDFILDNQESFIDQFCNGLLFEFLKLLTIQNKIEIIKKCYAKISDRQFVIALLNIKNRHSLTLYDLAIGYKYRKLADCLNKLKEPTPLEAQMSQTTSLDQGASSNPIPVGDYLEDSD